MHIANMFSLGGFEWLNAPMKWKLLDIAYLIIDFIVVYGFVSRKPIAISSFYIAAISQIVLYTVLRDWIIDVPETIRVVVERKSSYLDTLVIFHIVTLAITTMILKLPLGSASTTRGSVSI